MKPTDPPDVRPHLCDRVHAALVRAGRPVTRGELRMYMVNGSKVKGTDVQEALDAMVAEGLAAQGEERQRWQRFVTWRATGEKS